jgi:hypothetical protein
MSLPFTREQFLDLFGAFNTTFWPVLALLWVGTAGVVLALVRRPASATRWMIGLLVLQWAWSGIAYHLVYFRRINPAAIAFAAMFVAEAVLLGWFAMKPAAAVVTRTTSGWAHIGTLLLVYALAYPAIALVGGHAYPRLPLFGVPCPTVLLTIGVLLHVPARGARAVALIPLAWAVIGGSAAFLLGMHADLMLIVAGVALAVHHLRSVWERRASDAS